MEGRKKINSNKIGRQKRALRRYKKREPNAETYATLREHAYTALVSSF